MAVLVLFFISYKFTNFKSLATTTHHNMLLSRYKNWKCRRVRVSSCFLTDAGHKFSSRKHGVGVEISSHPHVKHTSSFEGWMRENYFQNKQLLQRKDIVLLIWCLLYKMKSDQGAAFSVFTGALCWLGSARPYWWSYGMVWLHCPFSIWKFPDDLYPEEKTQRAAQDFSTCLFTNTGSI